MQTQEIERVVAVEERNWWYQERRRIIAGQLRRLGRPGRAVDIGAAGGGNTRVLLEHGWEAVAVDMSEAAVDFARSRGVEACQGDACDLPLPTGSFDFAMALDVLEHVHDDRAAAAEMARVLRPGGAGFVTVPCDMALWSAHDVALGHVRRYTRSTLRGVLEGAGLRVEEMWSWNVLLRPVVRVRRRKATGCDLEEMPPLVNTVLRSIVAVERHLPVGSLPGVSLMARVQRL
ncbi:class I SAM-dependent methyltransferase [Spirillospora sp. NPDC050679]